MGRKKQLKEPREHITRDTLIGLLKAGALLGAAFAAPNAVRFLVPHFRDQKHWDRYYPSSIHREAFKLWRKGIVNVRELSEGYVVELTEKGRTETLKFDIEAMSISKQEPWDGKWRMVFFDIPKGDENIRKPFRENLKAMGFFQMQKSVYVHPYPCEREVKFLREVLHIPHSIKLAVVDRLENDEDLRRIFRLG